MAIQLTVAKVGTYLKVYAYNLGDYVVIIDHIVLSTDWSGGGASILWRYPEDFMFGPRVDIGWSGLMFSVPFAGGTAAVHATARYWEVDRSVKSAVINVS
jgi:hypothetical protein